MKVDVSDLKYQVSKDFAPDKESTWSFPPERDGWLLAHNSVRGEVVDLKAGITKMISVAPKGCPEWAVKALKVAWSAHYEHIHAHHHNEDDIFFPALSERFKMDAKLSSAHETISYLMEEISSMVEKLSPGDTLTALLSRVEEYEKELLPHLTEEEEGGVLLMRAYFTPEEIAPLIQKVLANGPMVEMGSFIYYMTPEKFRNEFMKEQGIPFFVWYIDFKGRLNTFMDEFARPVEQLKEGKEAIPSGFFAYLGSWMEYVRTYFSPST